MLSTFHVCLAYKRRMTMSLKEKRTKKKRSWMTTTLKFFDYILEIFFPLAI